MNMADNGANCIVCYHDARAYLRWCHSHIGGKKFHAVFIYATTPTNLRRVARNLAHTHRHTLTPITPDMNFEQMLNISSNLLSIKN